jgi:GT2 family glycosyltransferase
MARKEVFEQVGLLDEEFYIYCEEVDWSLRVRKAGWEIYCVPEARIVHYGGQSTQQFRGPMLVELHRSRDKLFKKHYSSLFRFAARQIVRLGITREIARSWLDARGGKLNKEELADRLNVYVSILKI